MGGNFSVFVDNSRFSCMPAIRSYDLSGLFTRTEADGFSHSESSIWWRKSAGAYIRDDQETLYVTVNDSGSGFRLEVANAAYQYCENRNGSPVCRNSNPTELCRFLSEDVGLLHHSAGCWHWTSDTYPADTVSLRSVASDNFAVVDITGEHQVIAEVSFPMAFATLHEKAIYLHEARQYQVEKFDYDGRKAYVRRVDSDYFTDAIDYTRVKELEQFHSREVNDARPVHGDVRVNTQVVGFKKVRFYTMENAGAGIFRCRSAKCTSRLSGCIFPQPSWRVFRT